LVISEEADFDVTLVDFCAKTLRSLSQ